jgi:hypothetical protein
MVTDCTLQILAAVNLFRISAQLIGAGRILLFKSNALQDADILTLCQKVTLTNKGLTK